MLSCSSTAVPLPVDITDTSDLSAPGWGLDLARRTLRMGFDLDIDLP